MWLSCVQMEMSEVDQHVAPGNGLFQENVFYLEVLASQSSPTKSVPMVTLVTFTLSFRHGEATRG